MAAKMAMASASSISHKSTCPDCGDSGRDMKAMGCSLALCASPAMALPAQTAIMMPFERFELPVPVQRSLFGWAHAPDPYPPRSTTLG
jgi:hypothetical protein